MSILKELFDILAKETITEGKKPVKKPDGKKSKKPATANKKRRAGKPHDGKHDDGTDLQFKDDRPYAKQPKYPQYIPGNMWFNMTKSGNRAGDLE